VPTSFSENKTFAPIIIICFGFFSVESKGISNAGREKSFASGASNSVFPKILGIEWRTLL
jgi:hypothetical protein